MDPMSGFGTVIGGFLCVMLVPLVTLRAGLGRAMVLGAAVVAASFVIGRIGAHYVVAPMLNAPENPGSWAEKLLPQGWLELVLFGGFVVMALVICIIARAMET